MRLLIISAAFPPMLGGESDHALHLSTKLAERGLDVKVLTVRGGETSKKLPFRVHTIMRDWSWSDLPRLIRFVKNCRPDAVLLYHSGWLYNDHPMVTFAPTITGYLRRLCPFVTQFGVPTGCRPEDKTYMTRAVRKAMKLVAGERNIDARFGTLLRDSNRIIVLGEDHRSMLSGCLPGAMQKMILIPPPPLMHMVQDGTGRKRGRELLGVGPEDFLLAYFGVLYRTKGVETLLKAFKKLTEQRKNAKLVLIGGQANLIDGYAYFEELCEIARELGIVDRVVARQYNWDSFDGSLYLQAADVCVLPFDNGVTLNRSSVAGAAAHGLPIITTRGSGLETPFQDRLNVLLCPPKDAASLAAAMESLMNCPALRQRLSDGAVKLAREWYSWDKALDQTITALQGG
jgi:glycosyltransferase involved in cell wall biosynthesis